MPASKSLPSLKQLRHLVAIDEFGHFGRAADSCFVTQSSLSASLKALETLLGRILVERTRRRVMMTPLGKDVAARARRLLADAGDIVDLVAAAGAPLAVPLRLGVIPTIGPFLLPRVMPALRRAYPDLKVYLREEQTADLIKGLAAGALDLLLIAFPYPTPGLDTHVFATDPFFVAFPPGHAFADRERLRGADLRGEELMLLDDGHCLRDHALSVRGLKAPPAAVQATSLATLVHMVDGGLGLTLLPKMAIDGGIVRGTRVQARPLEGRGAARRIGLAWRPTSARAGEFALLARVFRDELATPLTPGQGKRR